MRARIEAYRKRLREMREAEAREAADQARAEKDAKAAADVYLKIIQPALKTLTEDARGIVEVVLKRTLELHGDIVNAWGKMSKDAAAALDKAFQDEYRRGLGQPGTPAPAAPGTQRRNELPGPAIGGANIFFAIRPPVQTFRGWHSQEGQNGSSGARAGGNWDGILQ